MEVEEGKFTNNLSKGLYLVGIKHINDSESRNK